jgi:membrane-associated phospholipid phosphatase
VPGLGVADTVGLAGHDTGSFAGVRFNPYAAMPSLHVGWSILVASVVYRATSRTWLRVAAVLHPVLMALAVTQTGNHYLADSLAGALVALLAITAVSMWTHRPGNVPAARSAGVRARQHAA